jgi:hypothetical protein
VHEVHSGLLPVSARPIIESRVSLSRPGRFIITPSSFLGVHVVLGSN